MLPAGRRGPTCAHSKIELSCAKWNAKNDPTHMPRMLFLADRGKVASDPITNRGW